VIIGKRITSKEKCQISKIRHSNSMQVILIHRFGKKLNKTLNQCLEIG